MKKTILLAFLGAGLFTANAQTTNTTSGPVSDNVTLNVNLYPLQSIVVNPSSKEVNLDYKTPADYLGGVNKTEDNHLEVFSTGAFVVNVKSTVSSLTGEGEAIPLNNIKIHATQGNTATTGNPLTGFSGTEVTLSETDTSIGGSDTAGSGKINVNYSAASNNDYLSRVVGGAKTTYTANLVYSIIAN